MLGVVRELLVCQVGELLEGVVGEFEGGGDVPGDVLLCDESELNEFPHQPVWTESVGNRNAPGLPWGGDCNFWDFVFPLLLGTYSDLCN